MRWFAVQRSTQKASPSRCKEVKQSSRARCGPGPRGKKLKEQHGWLPGSPLSITRSVSYTTSRQRIPSAAKRHLQTCRRWTTTDDSDGRRFSPPVGATPLQEERGFICESVPWQRVI